MENVFVVTGQTGDIEVLLGVFSSMEKAEAFMESTPDNIYDNFMVSDMTVDDTDILEELRQLDTEGNSGMSAHNVVELFPGQKPSLKLVD